MRYLSADNCLRKKPPKKISDSPQTSRGVAELMQSQVKEISRSTAQLVKEEPQHLGRYNETTDYDGRKYYHRYDNSKRTTKIAGPITYVRGGRKATPKVPNKRTSDAAGHLIAHSFGGPPKFRGNFVAMDKFANSAGGDWGEMEHYIRKRLKARQTSAYMSVSPEYPNATLKRPNSITVTVHFNRRPYKKRFIIPMP